MRKTCISILTIAILVFVVPFTSFAVNKDRVKEIGEKGHKAIIYDDKDILTDEEEERLLKQLSQMTENGNMAVYTFGRIKDTEDTAVETFKKEFLNGGSNSTVLYVDMKLRTIFIESYGENAKVISSTDCMAITDAVYKDFSNANYEQGIRRTFEQINNRFIGKRQPKPIQLISAMFMAAMISIIINYIIMKAVSMNKKEVGAVLIKGAESTIEITDKESKYIETTKTYSPIEYGGGGGGSFHGGGGHHSGGGHHAGGHHSGGGSHGGHRF